MYYLLLGINAWTDYREGVVYDVFSAALFLYAVIVQGNALPDFPFWVCFGLLASIYLLDRKEEWMGRGDYLVLLSISLHEGMDWPMVLLVSCLLTLICQLYFEKPKIPFVPFLFCGSLVGLLWK